MCLCDFPPNNMGMNDGKGLRNNTYIRDVAPVGLGTHTLHLLQTRTHLLHQLGLQILQVIIPTCPLYLGSQTRSPRQILKIIQQKEVLPFSHSERWVDLIRTSRWKGYSGETSNRKWFGLELSPNCRQELRDIVLGSKSKNGISCALISS